MAARVPRILLLMMLSAGPAVAQHSVAAVSHAAPPEAKQFSFLIGTYDLTVHPAVSGLAARIHGVPKMVGTWKGWRTMDGFGVEDELRVTDESGNPRLLAHALRFYDAGTKRWLNTTVDVYRSVVASSTGIAQENAIITTSHGSDAEGKAYLMRGRYFEITPTSFKFTQERSYDEGKTWESGVLSIEAKRVAAAASR